MSFDMPEGIVIDNVEHEKGFDDYSGRAFVIVRTMPGSRYALVAFFYGSCSGCDSYDGDRSNVEQRCKEEGDWLAFGDDAYSLRSSLMSRVDPSDGGYDDGLACIDEWERGAS